MSRFTLHVLQVFIVCFLLLLVGILSFFIYPDSINTSVFAQSSGTVKAFPEAMGFGAVTKGGRGGSVIYVTNLNDSGAGSFRDAVQRSGPRIVLFKVAGTINLQNDISISQPYITIAGQTAPGQGVQIKGGMIKIETNEVIIRYLKVRKGNPTGGNPADTDSISIAANRVAVDNVIIDHSTLIWGTDIGGMSILTNSTDVTVQDTILGEGLYLSDHPEGVAAQGGHSMSLNLTQLNDTGYPTRITLYHNLLTSSDSRNPQMIQPASVDFINNVIYNWGNKSAYGNPKSLNLQNNYYVKGPLSTANYFWDLRVDADYPTQNNNAVYEAGNVAVGFTGGRSGPASIYTSSPRFTSSIPNPSSALEAYNHVVANAGANKPVRDTVDARIISNLTSKTFKHPNGTVQNRFINASDLVWPTLTGGTPPADSDNDGMPDSWEQQYFGNTSRGSSGDFDSDGYTDVEEYINSSNPKGGGSVTGQPTGQPTTPPVSTGPTTPPVSGTTSLSLTLLLHGIGKGGDNVNPTALGTMNPGRPQRTVSLEITDTNSQTVTKQGTVTYNSTAGNFQGTIPAGTLATGAYTVKVVSPQYLTKTIPGIVTLTTGQTKTIPALALTTGDTTLDNRLNILDYNVILDCYADIGLPKNCSDTTKKQNADITDDSFVNQFDYNLFLRELSVQAGQ